MANNWMIEQRIDLRRGVQAPQVWPHTLMMCGDNNAHTWRVIVLNGGEAAQIAGSVVGYFIRTDGKTVAVQGGLDGHVASVMLAQECYALEGDLRAVMRLTSTDGTKVTLSALILTVRNMLTDSIIDPGEVIPNLDDLLAQIEAMETATASATAAAESANAAASDATEASSTANASAQNAAEKAAAANAAAAAANAAAANANSAASNAEEGASAADSAAQSANAAADRVDDAIGSANTAAANAENKAALADAAAQSADTAADNADNKATAAEAAAAAANAAANRLSAVELDVTMLPPSAEPAASVEQTETKTTFSLGIPTSNLAYATFEVDATMELLMHSPDGFDDISFALRDGELEVSI